MEDVDLYNRVREQYTLGEGLLVLLAIAIIIIIHNHNDNIY